MNTVHNATTITAPPATPFLEVVREFDAPRADVFRAHVDPELVAQWLGPRNRFMRVDHWDATSGGSYRYLHHGNTDDPSDELQAWFHGTFHTVRADELIIQTFEFEGVPDEVALETARFEDLGGGRTRLILRTAFLSVEARDGALASGMEYGIRDSMDRLQELLTASA